MTYYVNIFISYCFKLLLTNNQAKFSTKKTQIPRQETRKTFIEIREVLQHGTVLYENL